MKKILMVSTVAMTIRGFYLAFPPYFQKKDYRFDAMAREISSCGECRETFENVWEVDWTRNPLDLVNILRSLKQIRAVVENEKYDLVHVCTPIAAFVVRLALRRMRANGKVKIIYTAHGFHFYKGGPHLTNTLFVILEKLAGRWTDYLMVVNREDERAALRYRIVPPDRLRYVPGCGIDTERFNKHAILDSDVESVRRELGIPPQASLFLMIADLIPRKQPWDILNAFAKLNRKGVHLLVAGGGPLMQDMRALASTLNLDGQVRFLGVRRDVPVLIRSSAATLLASRQEGLSQCVQESLALQVPVIATNIRGVRDLLDDGNGILVQPGDVEGFTRAMAWVLDHPEEARALGNKGSQRIEACNIAHVLRIHEDIYSLALTGR